LRKREVTNASVEQVRNYIAESKIEVLNVAGKSESKGPKIYDTVYEAINSVLSDSTKNNKPPQPMLRYTRELPFELRHC